MSESIAAIRQVYEQQLKAHYLAQYKAYCLEQQEGDRYDLGGKNRVVEEAIAQLPPEVQILQQQALDQGDSYYANIYQLSVNQQLTYAVRVTTDGDDGWLFVFDQQGHLLASAQTYLEVAVWANAQAPQAEILPAKTLPAETPHTAQPIDLLTNPLPGFEAAKSQTLWGKPVSELEASP